MPQNSCQSCRGRTAPIRIREYPEETKYIYMDSDSNRQQLDSQGLYAVTFAKGQTPAKGSGHSLFKMRNILPPLKRYSRETKNKNLKLNAHGY